MCYVGPTYRQAKLDRLQASLPDVPRSVTVAYRCRDYDNWLTLVIAQYDPAADPARPNTHIALGGSDMNGPLKEEELIEIAALLRPVLGP